MTKPTANNIGKILALVAHDLRNTAAALSANTLFLSNALALVDQERRLEQGPEEIKEALKENRNALDDLTRGLDQLVLLAGWLDDRPIAEAYNADLAAQLRAIAAQPRSAPVELELAAPSPTIVKGGGALPKLLDILICNSIQHAPGGKIRLIGRRDPSGAIVEVRDRGCAIAADLRGRAFSLEGQGPLKGRADGRYGRVVGLFAAGILAQAMGASLEANGENGEAVFRVRLKVME